MKSLQQILITCLVAFLAGCGGGSNNTGSNNTGSNNTPISVTISGLAAGTEVMLLNNNAEAMRLQANGTFTTQVPYNSTYSITVGTQPIGEICTVSNGDGDGAGASSNISNILVNCSVPPAINATTEVTTFSGSGIEGYLDGDGAVARFSNPHGIALDSAGNIYVADSYNNVIRKITQSGAVSTLAGSGSRGNSNGTGSAASFYQPKGVAVDSADNVYVADTGNNLIRKISQSGEVTTVAGSGFPGSSNGTGTQATFYLPSDIKFDSSGNLYVVDSGYGLIRKISPMGVVTTISAGFDYTTGIAIDSMGNLFVAAWNRDVIYKIDPNAQVSLFAGSGYPGNTNGLGIQASFFLPFYLAVDQNDNVYASEAIGTPLATTVNMDIRVITPLGMVSNYAGSGAVGNANGNGTVATFNDPAGIAFDGAGNLYVSDSSNNMIRKISRVN